VKNWRRQRLQQDFYPRVERRRDELREEKKSKATAAGKIGGVSSVKKSERGERSAGKHLQGSQWRQIFPGWEDEDVRELSTSRLRGRWRPVQAAERNNRAAAAGNTMHREKDQGERGRAVRIEMKIFFFLLDLFRHM
jgi:hypothetical protein